MSEGPEAGGPDAATVAAIVAAVDAVWPPANGPDEELHGSDASLWRFSARWWDRPTAGRRSRPW